MWQSQMTKKMGKRRGEAKGILGSERAAVEDVGSEDNSDLCGH